MMKNLTLALGLMIIASPAFATTPRLTALGEDPAGSYYIQDVRNIFLNPAQIVHYKKKLVLEFNPTVAQMGPLSPQGLFTNTFGDYTYGLSLNNNSARASNVASFATPILAGTSGNGTGTNAAQTGYGYSAGLLPPDRTIELFFAGGDASLGWGLSLFYSGNGDKGVVTNSGATPGTGSIERTSHVFGARAGVEAGNLQAFATVGITSDTKLTSAVQSANVKGKISIDAAVTYAMDNTTAFAKFTTYGADVNTSGFPVLPFTSPFEYRYNSFGIGLGHKYEASKTITLFGRIEVDYIKLDNINNVVATNPTILQGGNTKTWSVPIAIGAEAQALSWLTLRGSVTQSLWSQANAGVARATGGKTVLGSGAGLTLGDVQIDGTLSAAVNPGNNGFGIGNPFGNVAMTYNF